MKTPYEIQKENARRRGIPFHLTRDEWREIWEASGYFNKRGRRRGQYVMARFGDRGAYEIGNVKIVLVEDNLSEVICTDALRASRSKRVKGSLNPHSKLTIEQVHEIRALNGKLLKREIAAKFGVSDTMISYIHSGKNWR